MIYLEKIKAIEWGTLPTYRDSNGKVYTESEVYTNWQRFDIVGRDRDMFIKAAKRQIAREASRRQVRPSKYGKWDSGEIVKEQFTDTLMGVQR